MMDQAILRSQERASLQLRQLSSVSIPSLRSLQPVVLPAFLREV